MNNKSFLTLFFLLFLISFSCDLTCAIKAKNSVNNTAKNTQVTAAKTIQANPQEEAIIEEIKSLLKDRRMPSLAFNEWVDTHAPVLLKSNKEPVKKLGETLQAIRQGKITQINPFKVLPNFDKAVQAYHPEFKRSILGTPGLIAKGISWHSKK